MKVKLAGFFVPRAGGLCKAACAAAVAAALLLSPVARAQDSLASQVDFSIQRGVAYLYRLQAPDGSIAEPQAQHPVAGITALSVLALLSAGEPPTKPEIRKALSWLSEQNLDSTYTIALRAAVFSQLTDAEKHPLLRRDTQKLIAMQIDGGDDRGFYTYRMPPRNAGIADLSNSQYGVLGVWYAAEAGIEIPRGYWQRVEEAWSQAQNPDGGFGYRPDDKRSYGSMTAAGIATLAITQDFLHANSAVNPKPSTGTQKSLSLRAAEKAVGWLNKYFIADRNAGLDSALEGELRRQGLGGMQLPGIPPGFFGRQYVYYMLYGYERVGEATGLIRFKEQRWFDEGARYLISAQSGDGSWQDGTFAGPIDTAYALLFLSRGRAPVVVQKLQLEDARWNNRTRDAASLVRWLRKQTERHVNWQLVRLDYPMRDLRESPILYVASDESLKLPEAEIATLKQYLDEGGLLLAADESEKQTFAKSVEKLLEKMYPRYIFRDAEADHPFLAGNFPTDKLDVPVRVIGNGVRELAVVLPKGDMPWRWQKTLGRSRTVMPEFSLVGNILVNVTGRANLRFKGTYHLEDLDRSKPAPEAKWNVARIQYSGNWNPEPLAWSALQARLHNKGTATLTTVDVNLELEPLRATIPLAHMTATHTPVLKEAEKNTLASYLKEGGILFFDAAGGDASCGIWAESLMKEMMPGVQIKDLPLTHQIYQGVLTQAGTVEYRPGATTRVGSRRAAPRLRAAYQGTRLVGIISAEDLTSALVGYSHDHIPGYTPETARRLVTNILKYVYGG